MNGDQAKSAGFDFIKHHLRLINEVHGRDVAVVYAHGIVCYAKDFTVEHIGHKEAFNKFAQIADDVLLSQLPEDKR